jgi:hypothetical protein
MLDLPVAVMPVRAQAASEGRPAEHAPSVVERQEIASKEILQVEGVPQADCGDTSCGSTDSCGDTSCGSTGSCGDTSCGSTGSCGDTSCGNTGACGTTSLTDEGNFAVDPEITEVDKAVAVENAAEIANVVKVENPGELSGLHGAINESLAKE